MRSRDRGREGNKYVSRTIHSDRKDRNRQTTEEQINRQKQTYRERIETEQTEIAHSSERSTHFITMTPLRVAASTSMLSTPVPARPTILRAGAAARTSLVTLVAERTTIPSWLWGRKAGRGCELTGLYNVSKE